MPFWINLIVALTAFAVSAVMGKFLIPLLKKIHFGQTIYDKGPSWHKDKQGTPIMGGFMFVFGSAIAIAVGYALYRYRMADVTLPDNTGLYRLLAGYIFALLNMVIGFTDDYIKAVKKQNLGLKPKQKIVMQFIFSAAFLYVLYVLGDTKTTLNFYWAELDIGWFYYPFMLLVIVFLTNAVNLTDGIDGLCGSVTVISMISFATLCSAMGNHEYSIYSIAVAGGCLGFLVWNLHPAKVFMGDTGSMFLGGLVVGLAFCTGRPILLIVAGIQYIIEAFSVILQVAYYKKTKKRLFRMSPIHHHFEMGGYSEEKIVLLFSAVTAVGCVVALLPYII